MNNLKLSSELSLRLDLQSKDEVVLFCAFDIEGNRLFFASSSNLIYKTQLPSLPVSSFVSRTCTFVLASIGALRTIGGGCSG